MFLVKIKQNKQKYSQIVNHLSIFTDGVYSIKIYICFAG
jgi:hypothetical protein